MLKSLKTIVFIGLCLMTLSGCSLMKGQVDQQPALTQGQAIPDVTLTNQDGQTVSLKDYAGKTVYINVWASWCGPCKHEFPELESLYQDYKAREDVVFLSITSPNDTEFGNKTPADESKDTILKTAKEGKISYPILFDTKDSFMSAFGIRAFPTHIIIASDGTISNITLGGATKNQLSQLLEKVN